jgi:hypothetical protein
MYPNAVTYQAGKSAGYYIKQAGGYTDRAKKSKAYVVNMNGTVAKISSTSIKAIQPGSAIIVPTKEERQKMTTAEILSLGSSIASLAMLVVVIIGAL